MKYGRLVSLLTVWVFLANAAFATSPPPATRSAVAVRPVEVTRENQVPPSKKPSIKVNWTFKGGKGSTDLLVNSDGSYHFSGNYKPEAKGKYLELVLAVFRKPGIDPYIAATYWFQYLGNASAGNVKWSKKGKNSVIGSDFQLYKKGYSWRGAYRLLSPAESKQVKVYLHGTNVVDVDACRKYFVSWQGGAWGNWEQICKGKFLPIP